jgi:hypothetical protein
MTGEILQIGDNPVLAEHAAEIRRLGQSALANLIEIGRHLTEVKAKLKLEIGHGHFGRWLELEFGWTDRTARRYMQAYENRTRVSEMNLPIRSLHLLSAPSTPDEARDEIISRAAGGEPMSGGEVQETVAREKGEKGEKGENGGPAEAETETETETAPTSSIEPTTSTGESANDGSSPAAGDGDNSGADGAAETATQDALTSAEGAGDDVAAADPTSPAPAPNPIASAAAAVNQLSPTDLQKFLEQLWPAPRHAFELKFGARNSDSTNAKIATLARECSALLAHPKQHIDDIHKKLARIKKLTGSDGKARTKTAESNAQLDRGAFTRAIGTAGQPGEKFQTINAAKSAGGTWK